MELAEGIGLPIFAPFEPEDWIDRKKNMGLSYFINQRPHNPQVFIPLFPTVYPPSNEHNRMSDIQYLHSVYATASSLRHMPNAKVLVVGPGSGLDAWIAWVASVGAEIFAVGINPFEVANLRALARMAGFPVDARIHDNILTWAGRSIFGSQKFAY